MRSQGSTRRSLCLFSLMPKRARSTALPLGLVHRRLNCEGIRLPQRDRVVDLEFSESARAATVPCCPGLPPKESRRGRRARPAKVVELSAFATPSPLSLRPGCQSSFVCPPTIRYSRQAKIHTAIRPIDAGPLRQTWKTDRETSELDWAASSCIRADAARDSEQFCPNHAPALE